MPRTARLYWPQGVFHVVSRFAEGVRWLDRPGAREAYLYSLETAALRTDAQVLAYCLMSNHVHLVAVQGQDPLERLTKSVHTGFSGWANRSHRRRKKASGPVFAGRPRTILLQEDYLLELVRYVHNNPVRAGVSRLARTCSWSSHQAYVGRVKTPGFLHTNRVLRQLGRRAGTMAARFDDFVNKGRAEHRRPELSGQSGAAEAKLVRDKLRDGQRFRNDVLGSEAFVSTVLAGSGHGQPSLPGRRAGMRSEKVARPALRDVLAAVLEVLELDAATFAKHPRVRLCAHAKRLTTWIWVREYDGQQIDVARMLGITTAAVSRQYSEAVQDAADYEAQGSAAIAVLQAKLTRRRRARAR